MWPKPLLLVDIDGVISLWGFAPDRVPEGTWANVEGIGHFLSAEAVRELKGLEEFYELVWCSGWEERANEHLPHHVGVRPLPHISFDRAVGGRSSSRAHWKLDAIDAYAGDRPLAWIDDALNDECHAWAAERATHSPTLLITTAPATGLTRAQGAELAAWARGVASVLPGGA